jgi:hypothetical protein
MDTYTFEITLEDTGDEFSETFNPKDEEAVRLFEEDLAFILSENGWDVASVRLVKVNINL